MKKIAILGVVAVLLTLGLVAMSCGAACDNSGDCGWTKVAATGLYTNSANGVCTNTDSCVIFDSDKGLEAYDKGKEIPCDC